MIKKSTPVEAPNGDDPMQKLSSALDVCAPLLTGKIVYLDYPVHDNVGDLLIWMGAQTFLKRHKKKITGRFSIINVAQRALRLLDECSTICFHGGGNLGDIWTHHQKFRERIIQKYPHKKIVILPQTVHFDDPNELDKACAIFKAHPDLHIFARDKSSFTILNDKHVPNLMLCPDMAHALWGTIQAPDPTLSSPLYLLRRDKEKTHLPLEASPTDTVDWEDLLTGWTRYAFKFGVRISHADGGKGKNYLPAYTTWDAAAKILIHRAIDMFAPYETIITDRLHAMILAALMKRKSIVFDNSYGKISSYIDCWMRDVPNISFQKGDISSSSSSNL